MALGGGEIVVPIGWALLPGSIGLGIFVDEVPPGEDGEERESGPLGGVDPTEPVSLEGSRDLPPSCGQACRGEEEELEVEQEGPAREPALPHGKSVDAVGRTIAWTSHREARPSRAEAGERQGATER